MERKYLENKYLKQKNVEIIYEILKEDKYIYSINIYKEKESNEYYVQAYSEEVEGPFSCESECFCHIINVLMNEIDRYSEAYEKINDIITRM